MSWYSRVSRAIGFPHHRHQRASERDAQVDGEKAVAFGARKSHAAVEAPRRCVHAERQRRGEGMLRDSSGDDPALGGVRHQEQDDEVAYARRKEELELKSHDPCAFVLPRPPARSPRAKPEKAPATVGLLRPKAAGPESPKAAAPRRMRAGKGRPSDRWEASRSPLDPSKNHGCAARDSAVTRCTGVSRSPGIALFLRISRAYSMP